MGNEKLPRLEFSVNEDWKKFVEENSWLSFIPEFATDSEGNKFMKGRGRTAVYKVTNVNPDETENYECTNCGEEILGVKVAHPIWDGPFPCSGSGKCHYENVPYFPKCEQEPKFHGTPIKVPFNYDCF